MELHEVKHRLEELGDESDDDETRKDKRELMASQLRVRSLLQVIVRGQG